MVIGLAVWLSPAAAWAICPYPVPKACSAYFENDTVFVGTVMSHEYVGHYERFEVRVSRVFRGSVAPTAVVYTGNDTGRVLWDVGRESVVFAWHEKGRLLSGGDCGPLSDPNKVSEAVSEIEALQRSGETSVEGEVLRTLPEGAGVPGVPIRVFGDGRRYGTTSDARGRFRLLVVPGRYRIEVDPKTARHSDYNGRIDLNDLVLVRGQCAQLQFVAN